MPDSIVETENGKIRGSLNDGVHTFKGIPYGADTGGKNRFLPPLPPAPWAGIKDCLNYGARCPQKSELIDRIMAAGGQTAKETQSEDCLFLNVWTPGINDGKKRPVMFWCHGGGFTMGSGSARFYDGANLTRRGDVVVVTVNHRLGPFGYLELGDSFGVDYAASGNTGMLDLVLALKWVRENIGGFGGNSGNVTIFGESGGGSKVSVLMAMPSAAGLFHRAIVESGPGWRMVPREKAAEQTNKLLQEIGVKRGEINKLQGRPAAQIIQAAADINRNLLFGWWPAVDGHVLPRHPFDPAAPDISSNVPLVIGTNKDEATLFISLAMRRRVDRNGPLATAVRNFILQAASRRLAQYIAGDSAKKFLDTYRQAHENLSGADLFAAILTDAMMRIPSIIQAERKYALNTAPVFMYLFSWETAAFGGRLKATHGLEIPFVFGNLSEGPLIGTGEEQQVLSRSMSESWISFARNGIPGYSGIPAWPPYTPDTRATMIFDRACRVENDPFGAERFAWNGFEPLSVGKSTGLLR